MEKGYPRLAVEMKVQEIILRAIGGQMTWIEAAAVLRISVRSVRRWRERYEEHGYDGLFDRRLGQPSPKRVPLETVEKVLRLYREVYYDFNCEAFSREAGGGSRYRTELYVGKNGFAGSPAGEESEEAWASIASGGRGYRWRG